MNQKSIFSLRKLLQNLFLFSLLFLTGFAFAQSVPAPISGDFRSKLTGEWASPTTWEVYTCNAGNCDWVDSTIYPGQGTSSTNQATYNVFIQQGTEVNVSNNSTYYFGNLYILANNPVINISLSVSSGPDVGRINLMNNGTELKLLGTNQNIYIFGGVFYFRGNNTQLGLLSGNSIIITDYNGVNAETGLGSNGLQQLGLGCNGNQKIKFYNEDGTLVESEFGVCSNASSPYSFLQLNFYGGSLATIFNVVPPQICVGEPSTITTSYSGIIPSGKTANYIIELESSPTGYTFSPISGTFTAPGNAASIPDITLDPFALAGTYTYTLTISYPYDNTPTSYMVFSKRKITLEVNERGTGKCACYKDPILDPLNKYPTKFGITSLGRAGSATNSTGAFWPEIRQGGHMVIESQTKGFVINRVANTNAIAIPVEGMIVFDLSDGQLKIYTLKEGDTTPSWQTFTKPTCPIL